MGIKSFVLGGLIGFSLGVYHGYNYASENVVYDASKTAVVQEYGRGLDICSDTVAGLDLIIRKEPLLFSKDQEFKETYCKRPHTCFASQEEETRRYNKTKL